MKPQEQLQGQAPHHQFREQHQGTLPEQLTEINLVALNSALGFLFTHLREARWKFEHEKDNGRFAAFIALGAFWQFVVLFDRPFAESLQVPILLLQDALGMLDNNHITPILKPILHRGRSKSSQAHATLKGHAAATVKRLLDSGLGNPDA